MLIQSKAFNIKKQETRNTETRNQDRLTLSQPFPILLQHKQGLNSGSMVPSSPRVVRGIFFLMLALVLSSSVSSAQDVETVRVRLMRNFAPQTIVVSSSGTLRLFAGDPQNPIQQLGPHEKITITTSTTQVYFQAGSRSIYARSLVLVQDENAELTIEVARARTAPPPRTYKGAFVVQVDPAVPSALSIENEVGIEDYIAGVLASEFNYREIEASKAVAVCIRTLTLQKLIDMTGPALAFPDDEMWQVYQGTGTVNQTVLDAVRDTRGQILLHNGQLAEAVYFASSGGHTANNEDVWTASRSLPYLRGKPDPYDRNSPYHNWESTIPRDQLLNVLSERYQFRVTRFRPVRHSRDRRVSTMLLSGDGRQENVSGNDFRLLVTQNFGRESLKSTLFEMNEQPDLYIFTGKGFGHGVGLNQWGALQLARKGNLYNEILGFYFEDLSLDTGGQINPLITVDQTIPQDESMGPVTQNESFTTPNTPTPTGSDDDPVAKLFGADDGGPAVEQPAQSRRATRPERTISRTSGHSGPTWNAKAENPSARTNKPAKKKRVGW